MRARSWIIGAFGLATACALLLGACSDDDTSAPIADTWPDADVKDAPFVPYDVGPFPDAGTIDEPGCYLMSGDYFDTVRSDQAADVRRGACSSDDIVAIRTSCFDDADASSCEGVAAARTTCAECLGFYVPDAASSEPTWGAVYGGPVGDGPYVDTTGCVLDLAGDDGGCVDPEVIRHYCDDHACDRCAEGDREACDSFARTDLYGCRGFSFGDDDAGVAAAARCEALYNAGASNPSIAFACGLDAASFDDAFDRVATVLCGP
ncbi:MAG TPA: hypothetical protein VF407_19020 [Polyangiaceae bacterium]